MEANAVMLSNEHDRHANSLSEPWSVDEKVRAHELSLISRTIFDLQYQAPSGTVRHRLDESALPSRRV